MAEPNVETVRKFLAEADSARAELLQRAAAGLAERAQALEREVSLAREQKAEDSDEIAARASAFQDISDGIAALAVQESHLPIASEGVFLIQGQLSIPKGSRKKFQLSITDPKQSIKGRIAAVTPDEDGFFTLALRAAEFPDLVVNKTDLLLRITDGSGKEVFAPPTPVRLEPGRVALFSAVAV